MKQTLVFSFFLFAFILSGANSVRAQNTGSYTCDWDFFSERCYLTENSCQSGYEPPPGACNFSDRASCLGSGERSCQISQNLLPSNGPTIIDPEAFDDDNRPFPPPYQACDQTYNWNDAPADFHSLRPFQASSCYPEGTDINYFMCGNDLIAVEKFTLSNPNQDLGGINRSCRTEVRNGDTVHICEYDFEDRIIEVDIDLSTARLPFMGMTEGTLENNSQYQPFGDLTKAQKTNEFVSWYLNGANNRAEHNQLVYYKDYPQDQEELSEQENDKLQSLVQETFDFAGPLNKLLPRRVQQDIRVKQIYRGTGEGGKKNDRHNQIVGCLYNVEGQNFVYDLVTDLFLGGTGAVGDIFNFLNSLGPVDYLVPDEFTQGKEVAEHPPGPCYPELDEDNDGEITSDELSALKLPSILIPDLKVDIERKRLSSWLDQLPPKREDFDSFSDYWRAYQNWRGDFCPSIGFFYFCFDEPGGDTLRPNWPGELFSYIPLSSTEDLEGWVEPIAAIKQIGGQVSVTSAEFQFDSGNTVDHKLYFPHMQEASELAQIAQTTFVTGNDTEIKNNWLTIDGFTPNETRDSNYDTNFCEPLESRSGPGDSLFGNYDGSDGDDEPISGTIKYSGNFTCEFQETIDQQGVQDCLNEDVDPPNDFNFCVATNTDYSTCEVEARTALSIYVGTPKVQEVWERLVDGSQSIFKRFYPKVGVGRPVEEIEDIPAETQISYSSSADQTFAGNPDAQRPGSNAKLYFPHLGSIYDYFLKGIQKALRPHGSSFPITTVGQSLAPIENTFESIACPTGPYKELTDYIETDDGGACEINCEFVPDFAIPSKYQAMKDDFIDYVNRWYYPKNSDYNYAEKCFNDVVDKSLEVGVNPVYSLEIWAQESGASNYEAAGCEVQDFGINDPSIASNFKAQLGRFLRLPFYYPQNYPQCFEDGCNVGSFSRVYQQGADAECTFNNSAQSYATKTITRMGEFTDCIPKYPTDLSCP